MKAYCVNCKAKRKIVSEEDIYSSMKYRVIKGKCSICGRGMHKILKNKKRLCKI